MVERDTFGDSEERAAGDRAADWWLAQAEAQRAVDALNADEDWADEDWADGDWADGDRANEAEWAPYRGGRQ